MATKDIINDYKFEPAPGDAPNQIVVLLHGVGSNGQDLISLAPFWAQYLPDAIFISPDAPYACDMMPPGYPNSFQWFSLQSRDPQDMLQGVQNTAPLLENYLNTLLSDYNIEADKMALVGFSQGTMTSLYVAPRYSKQLAGVLGYSGALIGAEEFSQGSEKYKKIPIHLIHGEDDDVVPVELRGLAEEQLKDAGFEVSGYTTPGLAHGIDEKGIKSGGEFLKSILLD